MSTQTTPDQSFPAPCKRCGGRLYQPADLCPYCGVAHPLATPSPARVAGVDGQLHRPPQTRNHPEAVAPKLAARQTPAGPSARPPPGSALGARWLLTRGLMALVAVILGYGAYILFVVHETPPAPRDEQDTRSTAGAIAPYSPDQVVSSRANPGAVNPPRVLAPVVVPHYRDLSESLRAAHTYQDAHNVSGAQTAVNAALSMEPDNADAQLIQHDLTPLEQRRDAALRTAHTCIKDHSWNCVEHSASEALAADSGSPEAQSLLQQAIVQNGWAPLASHAAPATRTAQVRPPPAAAQAPQPPQPAQSAQSAQSAPVVNESPPAPAPDNLDAQERAIVESGWRNAPASAAAPGH
jgi:hypothetical protein